jgi:hypothetical protein
MTDLLNPFMTVTKETDCECVYVNDEKGYKRKELLH